MEGILKPSTLHAESPYGASLAFQQLYGAVPYYGLLCYTQPGRVGLEPGILGGAPSRFAMRAPLSELPVGILWGFCSDPTRMSHWLLESEIGKRSCTPAALAAIRTAGEESLTLRAHFA